ncbi:DNA-binding MarR family transcriptional regulator [Nocardioides salarius]|uniref:DNA-binding MarR family transcriptional regulator n=1 Tax=Nocardioides salarius TaxID=374513 RepID=A0ABS2M7K7_9ACTN|nr:MarR family transcriptional regulator [Nocardioides salarius]MBM7507167.1 DNA-binding MarR family transcriptional regulator [Nocardioides salarius]
MINHPDDLRDLSSDLVVHAARLVRLVRLRHDLTAGFRTLALLEEHGPLGVTRLAELDQCSQPTMSNVVTALVERGQALKSAHPADARASVVELTDPGRRALAEQRAHHAAFVADLVAATDHTAQDVATAVAVLRDLTEKGHL